MLNYQIIATGSKGNAVVINDSILIDCGVPFKSLKKYYKKIKLVLLTHEHTDHFNSATIKKLYAERPAIRFACGVWLAQRLINCGVSKQQIDVLDMESLYGYGICKVIPFSLTHNVPNCGWKILLEGGEKIIYATDTHNLNGIKAKDYTLYLIEANYTEEDIEHRIQEKKANGEYAYEMQARKNHLSKEKCDKFLADNMGDNSVFVYMHQHRSENGT